MHFLDLLESVMLTFCNFNKRLLSKTKSDINIYTGEVSRLNHLIE